MMVLNLSSVPCPSVGGGGRNLKAVGINISWQAKQKASMKWILSKAFNNRVPENLKDPFYRDHEGQEHLKPQIVVGLGNASLYCQTLSNLYSDPNYQSLNHWSILQTLTRKGIPCESPDMPLTETVLIQTNPLRINAHMSVIEALMILYAKEVTSSDRVSTAIGRISGGTLPSGTQNNHEQALLYWVSHVCAALKRRIDQEIDTGFIQDENGGRLQSPDMPPIRDYRDLCDGVCLAYLISYYCPKIVPWNIVRVNYLPTVEDSIHNVLLVSNFSQKNLPYSVFHMTPEDITYMRGSMKQNLVVLLGDLFNVFELHPAKSVCYPGMDPQSVSRSPSTSTIRKNTPPRDEREHQSQAVDDEGFVVHKSRGVTTLSSMQEPLVPARLRQAKEKSNMDTKADERGDSIGMAAGRPSNWENARQPSYAGRRSRRNSFTEDSQLTIENFGGSQDHLNMIGRTQERERRPSITHVIHMDPAIAVRSTKADARGTIQIGYDNDSGSEKQDRETEKITGVPLRRQTSMDNVSAVRNVIIKHSKEKDMPDGDGSRHIQSSPPVLFDDDEVHVKRKTSITSSATLPKQTTWQQQSANLQQNDTSDTNNDETRPAIDTTKLSTIRMKLEEKRRNIEQEKRKMELALSRQQQKVGKAAFLQAINKGKVQNSSDGGDNVSAVNNNKISDIKDNTEKTFINLQGKLPNSSDGGEHVSAVNNNIKDNPDKTFIKLQDITSGDIGTMESKWDQPYETKKTPDMDHIDLETYQQSIAMMNTSLYDIQSDIQRLAQQQNQIQAQHLQAQQLLQAQQYANMMQQQYGSQHNIGGGGLGGGGGGSNINSGGVGYRQIQQNFGSSPHLPSQTGYNLNRPPSRDPHQNVNQYINDQGQYVNQMFGREGSPGQYSNDNGHYGSSGGGGGGLGSHYGGSQYMDQNQYRQEQSPQPAQYQQHQDIYNNRDTSNQFYLHDSPTPPPRRTWAQSAAQQPNQQIALDINAWSQNAPQTVTPPIVTPQKIDTRTWKSPHQVATTGGVSNSGGGFVLHQQNGGDHDNQEQSYQNLFPVHSSPQHTRIHKQISQIINSAGIGAGDQQSNNDYKIRDNRMPQSPPPDEMMAPQSISFLGDEEDSVEQMLQHTSKNLSKLNITSGSRTYRIPSPTRPQLNANSFQHPQDDQNDEDDDDVNGKGFYISFDNEQPKRPKPPLRAKKSPKKERPETVVGVISLDKREQISQLEKELDRERLMQDEKHNRFNKNNYSNEEPIIVKRSSLVDTQTVDRRQQQSQQQNHTNQNIDPYEQRRHLGDVTNYPVNINNNNNSHNINENRTKESKALVIGAELSNLDPTSANEMEKKKEKIMLLSLQRRQQQEEVKATKEIEVMQRREREQEKEEERTRRKDEQAARRQVILETHKLKKAIEEAEREGKTIDKADLMMMKQHNINVGQPKLRQQKTTPRPRPKTIHVDTGSVDLSEISSLASRGKKGSSLNLTGHGSLSSNSMRRDYYRGSQDSLAIRESPDEYPSTSSTPLGRRGSYKTARDTDSGLGRATPPRRAPSPGMGQSSRHLPSPSGPGSLPPGLMNKRRMFEDGSSELSSTPSSMMEYSGKHFSGPKLYKAPAAKSNRGIILNAVEYCVFPGAVNRDAKQKVLEKIARAEATHFLILFRDAGQQFRALYSFCPENETILKLYGTGPSQVDEVMFDRFFKYNSGGKCFSQIHTKHITVTIDAFTIHNSLWQGKKVNLPSKKDMALVI